MQDEFSSAKWQNEAAPEVSQMEAGGADGYLNK